MPVQRPVEPATIEPGGLLAYPKWSMESWTPTARRRARAATAVRGSLIRTDSVSSSVTAEAGRAALLPGHADDSLKTFDEGLDWLLDGFAATAGDR